jgi:NAD+ kinase
MRHFNRLEHGRMSIACHALARLQSQYNCTMSGLQHPAFNRIGLVGKPAHTNNASGLQALAGVAQWLATRGDLWVETSTAANVQLQLQLKQQAVGYRCCALIDLPQHVDAIVVVGGDGTLLSVARDLAAFKTPLIGINQGQLGFMTDIALQSFEADLAQVLSGVYTVESRSMIVGELLRGSPGNKQVIASALALNDAVISRGASASMVDVSVTIDGTLAYRLRADGIVVATPTGSTAYSLSANGPILHPTVRGLLIAPVAPQTLSNRPIVLPDSSVIDMTIEASRGTGSSASFDMTQWQQLQAGDVVRIQKSPLTTTLVHPLSYDYYNTLRQKLHWTYNPIQTYAVNHE